MPDAPRRGLPPMLGPALFFIIFYLYVWLRIDTRLLFESGQWFPALSLAPSEFVKGFALPSGPTQVLTGLLAQAFGRAWAGALIFTALAALVSLCARSYFTALSRRAPGWLALVPSVLILVTLGRYGQDLAPLLASLGALACTAAYVRATALAPSVRVIGFLILSPLIYYVIGGPYMLFAFLCGILELRIGESRLPGLVWLLAAEAIPYVFGALWLQLSVDQALGQLMPGYWSVDPMGAGSLALYVAFFPPAAIVLAYASQGPPSSSGATRPGKSEGARGRLALLGNVLALVAAVGVVTLSFDDLQHNILKMEMYARQGDWQRVLSTSRQIPREKQTIGTAHNMNRALVELGTMGDEMFAYPQALDGLMMGLEVGTQASRIAKHLRMQMFFQITDLPMRMGLMDDAEHDHHEALEVFGPHGCTLKRLALINIVKGQVGAGRIFLRAATHDLVYGKWARQTLARMERDPSLSSDPEVAHMRAMMLGPDVAYLGHSLEKRCLALLDQNPKNVMALDYLMALYLLSRRLDALAENMHRADAMGLSRLPRHWAEGLAVYCGTDEQRLEQYGGRISTDIMRSYVDFAEGLQEYEAVGDLTGAREATAARYGNSYFYYHAFGVSGVGAR